MLIVVKGAGDLASGVACRLKKCGFQVVMTEIAQPTVIRRTVAFADAVYQGCVTVEGITAVKVNHLQQLKEELMQNHIPVVIDPTAEIILDLKPEIVVDAIIAKYNTGTSINDAGIVIGLGPGFIAGKDVHAVVETKRGHYLGHVIYQGSAEANTGCPGSIGGFSKERLLKAPTRGIFKGVRSIGDYVKSGETVAIVGGVKISASIDGVLRGILKDGLEVTENMKVGDIDPRGIKEYCFTISDKAISIAGGVLEAIFYFLNHNKH
ncbi:MAG: selenium-dependent molybdenum cofactor biosynthesis protein YqeB [Desulfitobacteriaceae bacterium]|nr:selenium-dependent molybdenum cofactor biosynthesis protein YqeB [Desulfitobacteriaceae bacterium]MDD4752167.1 selenium-dependent molybdenum cofactor biosynthesis protein YqeB [Desulfitobacteriaceae bacterium]